MLEIIAYEGDKVGILDNGTVAWRDIYSLVSDVCIYHKFIKGFLCYTERGQFSMLGSGDEYRCVVYDVNDILYSGDKYSLILDRKNEVIHVARGSLSLMCFWISMKGKLKVKTLNSRINDVNTSETYFDENVLFYGCKTAREVNDSLFIKFGSDCMLEVYKLGNNNINYLIVE